MRVMLALLVLAVAGAVVAVALGSETAAAASTAFGPMRPRAARRRRRRQAQWLTRAIVHGDAARACAYAAGATFQHLRCARRPRSERYLSAVGEVRAYHVHVDGERASVWLQGISPGPGHSFELRRVGASWRVVDDTAFGLA
jgi:hypothetical protein